MEEEQKIKNAEAAEKQRLEDEERAKFDPVQEGQGEDDFDLEFDLPKEQFEVS